MEDEERLLHVYAVCRARSIELTSRRRIWLPLVLFQVWVYRGGGSINEVELAVKYFGNVLLWVPAEIRREFIRVGIRDLCKYGEI